MTELKIALISATPLAIGPAAAAVGEAFPGGEVWNLLDDRLLPDLQREGDMTAPLAARMDNLIDTALAGGADGVILTCSQYGVRADQRDAAADGAAVLSADGPLFEATVALAPKRVLLVASLESAAADSTERLRATFERAGTAADIDPLVVPGAARSVPTAELISLLGEAIAAAVDAAAAPYDVIVLAQYSLAPAAEALRAHVTAPVLDGPTAAAQHLRALIAGGSQ